LTAVPHTLLPQVVDVDSGTQVGTYPQLGLLGVLLVIVHLPLEQVRTLKVYGLVQVVLHDPPQLTVVPQLLTVVPQFLLPQADDVDSGTQTALNLAVIFLATVIKTVQVAPEDEVHPVQPAKLEPVDCVAVRVTEVFKL
jgi:hypothetical protein